MTGRNSVRRTIFATAFAAVVCTTAVSAQQTPVAQQTPAERSMIRRDLVQATAKADEIQGFDWSFWPYLGVLVVGAFAVEAIRQRRRENDWRRQMRDQDDDVTPLPAWRNAAARH